MKEKLISLETAKLAKEKGYERGLYYFDKQGRLGTGYLIKGKDCIRVDSQTLLQDWLREEHNIEVVSLRDRSIGETDVIEYQAMVSDYARSYRNGDILDGEILIVPHRHFGGHKTHEEALEVGLFEALKLIK